MHVSRSFSARLHTFGFRCPTFRRSARAASRPFLRAVWGGERGGGQPRDTQVVGGGAGAHVEGSALTQSTTSMLRP